MLQWLTRHQLFTPGSIGAHENPAWHINKPFGFSYFPKEIAPVPQRWAATTGDLVYYREHDKVSVGLLQSSCAMEDFADLVD